MNITIIGTGFVGVVSAAVYSSFGNTVFGLDIDEKKVESLKNAVVPFYEPELEALLKTQQAQGNLLFTTDYSAAIPQSEVIIIAVGTPSTNEGAVNLDYVYASCDSLAPHIQPGAIIVLKSTVPPGTADSVKQRISEKTSTPFHIASIPEFLKEGTAVHDTLYPDRVVIGTDNEEVFSKLAELHKPLNAPILHLSVESAQMAKYTANAYLATRITFINEIADICETNGADVQEVIQAIGYDKRIGSHYWYPGLGYGGSCFPKDVKEISAYSRAHGLADNLFNQVNRINDGRITRLLDTFATRIGGWKDKKVAVLGLAFKPHTDDMREAPSTKIIPQLLEAGAFVSGYDPKAKEVAPMFIKPHQNLVYVDTIEEAVQQADVVIALIEWPEVVNFDFATHKSKDVTWIIDARNQLDKNHLEAAGYSYIGIGR